VGLTSDGTVAEAYAEVAPGDAELRVTYKARLNLGEVCRPQLEIRVQLHHNVICHVDQLQPPSERAQLRRGGKTIGFRWAGWPSSRNRILMSLSEGERNLIRTIFGAIVNQNESIRRAGLSGERIEEQGEILPLVQERNNHHQHHPRVHPRRRAGRLLATLFDPRPYLHFFRLVHYWNYSHVSPRRKATIGPGVLLAPNVSFRNGERVEIGARSHIGEYCALWAGDRDGRIIIGDDALFGPNVYITASNYNYASGSPVWRQPRVEQDVVIGEDVWLGAGVMVLPGVTIGEGCIVAAGSIVTHDLPPGAVAAGVPVRILKMRDGSAPPSHR
jgi:acetyltransferase-like isoleucine patch superfamily enzyme